MDHFLGFGCVWNYFSHQSHSSSLMDLINEKETIWQLEVILDNVSERHWANDLGWIRLTKHRHYSIKVHNSNDILGIHTRMEISMMLGHFCEGVPKLSSRWVLVDNRTWMDLFPPHQLKEPFIICLHQVTDDLWMPLVTFDVHYFHFLLKTLWPALELFGILHFSPLLSVTGLATKVLSTFHLFSTSLINF